MRSAICAAAARICCQTVRPSRALAGGTRPRRKGPVGPSLSFTFAPPRRRATRSQIWLAQSPARRPLPQGSNRCADRAALGFATTAYNTILLSAGEYLSSVGDAERLSDTCAGAPGCSLQCEHSDSPVPLRPCPIGKGSQALEPRASRRRVTLFPGGFSIDGILLLHGQVSSGLPSRGRWVSPRWTSSAERASSPVSSSGHTKAPGSLTSLSRPGPPADAAGHAGAEGSGRTPGFDEAQATGRVWLRR
jgi:hypothetical protein